MVLSTVVHPPDNEHDDRLHLAGPRCLLHLRCHLSRPPLAQLEQAEMPLTAHEGGVLYVKYNISALAFLLCYAHYLSGLPL
jgi:hypothetical protein